MIWCTCRKCLWLIRIENGDKTGDSDDMPNKIQQAIPESAESAYEAPDDSGSGEDMANTEPGNARSTVCSTSLEIISSTYVHILSRHS